MIDRAEFVNVNYRQYVDMRRAEQITLMAYVVTAGLENLGSNHSVVVGCDDRTSFFVCDTNHGGLWGTIDSFADLGQLGHGMVARRRRQEVE